MPRESETRRRTNLRAENNTNALVIASRAIALISSYMRRIDQSRKRSRVFSSRARFILPSFTLVYLRTPYSFDRTHTLHIHTCYAYMCIYDFSMCTSSFSAPLCHSRSSNFRDSSAPSRLCASLRSIDTIATLHHVLIVALRGEISYLQIANASKYP